MSENQPHVVRSLTLADDAARQRAGEILRALEGVESVEVAGQQLNIGYDFSHTSWAKVCEVLKNAGLYAPAGTFTRWRDSWREFQDQNMRENLGHRAACCSKPPPGAGRR